MHEIRFLPGQGWWVWPESGGKERKIVELAQQVIYHIKVVLVVYSRSRALILGLTERRNNTKYFNKKFLSLFYYDVMIFELELDFAQFFCSRGA